MEKEIKRILVIGVQLVHKLGFIGYRNHAKRLLDIIEYDNDFEVTHIFHPTKKIDDSRCTNNLENLYNCDGVIIASPNMTHFNYLQKLVTNSNCFIFCEKPPVTSLDEINYLENISLKNKKRIFFNFNLRFSTIHKILNKYSNSEELGKIIQINIISSMGLAYKKKYLDSWRADGKNNLHNIIENSSIHWIDLMIFNFGKSNNSNYFPRLISKNGSSFDTNSISLEFDNGLSSSIFTSYATPLIEHIMIIGTTGYIVIENDKLELFSPRDTFDDDGLFMKPKNKLVLDFNFRNSIQKSLENSLNYFLKHVKQSKGFDISQYKNSIISNKLVLSLQNFEEH